MNNDDERDFAEEEYNRTTALQEAQEERKAELNYLYHTILTNTIDAAKEWEKSEQANKTGNKGIAQQHAQRWATIVERTRKAEREFRNLADF